MGTPFWCLSQVHGSIFAGASTSISSIQKSQGQMLEGEMQIAPSKFDVTAAHKIQQGRKVRARSVENIIDEICST